MPITPTYTILTADRLIDARGGPPIDNGAVLLEGSTIASVGRATDIRAPEGAPVQTTHYVGLHHHARHG